MTTSHFLCIITTLLVCSVALNYSQAKGLFTYNEYTELTDNGKFPD